MLQFTHLLLFFLFCLFHLLTAALNARDCDFNSAEIYWLRDCFRKHSLFFSVRPAMLSLWTCGMRGRHSLDVHCLFECRHFPEPLSALIKLNFRQTCPIHISYVHGISIQSFYVQMTFFHGRLPVRRDCDATNPNRRRTVSGAEAYYQYSSHSQLLRYGSRGKLAACSLSSHYIRLTQCFDNGTEHQNASIFSKSTIKSPTRGYNYSFCFVSIYRWSCTEPDLFRLFSFKRIHFKIILRRLKGINNKHIYDEFSWRCSH